MHTAKCHKTRISEILPNPKLKTIAERAVFPVKHPNTIGSRDILL